jgi:hypothetical protein
MGDIVKWMGLHEDTAELQQRDLSEIPRKGLIVDDGNLNEQRCSSYY